MGAGAGATSTGAAWDGSACTGALSARNGAAGAGAVSARDGSAGAEAVRTGRSGRAGDGHVVPTLPAGRVVTGRVATGGAGGADGADGSADAERGRGRWRSCDTSSGGGAGRTTPGADRHALDHRRQHRWPSGGRLGCRGVRATGRAGGSAGFGRLPPPGPSASTLGRVAEPGVSTCPLAGRGGPAGRPGRGRGRGPVRLSATAGTRPLARPRRAAVPLAAPPAAGDAAADAAAAAAIAAAARSDAWRPRHTRAETTIWSFSASGVSLTQVRGSVR